MCQGETKIMDSLFDDRPTMYEGSKLSLRSELSSMTVPSTDISCLYSSDYMQVYPLLSVREPNNPLEFLILADNNSYLDLSESYLHLTCRVKKADGSNCGATDLVAPANLFFHMIFKNLEVYMNGKCISDSQNMYHFIAYINRLLTMPTSLKSTKLKNELWFPNISPNTYEATSAGYKDRYQLAALSKSFSLMGQLVGGIFQQPRWIPAGTELKIVLRRNPANFCLDNKVTTTAYKYEIEDAVFLVARKPVSPKIIELHRSLLEKNETFKFITPEAVVKTISIPAGMTSITSDAILIGAVPKVIVIGLVKSSAVAGVLTESPTNFEHFNLSNVTVTWQGDSIETRSIPLNFKTATNTSPDAFLLGLHSLQKCVANELMGAGISRDNYTQGRSPLHYWNCVWRENHT